MEGKNLVFSTVAILVCVVMIGCCLVPIVQDSIVGKQVTKTVTYTNEISGTKNVYQLASGDTITIDLSGYTVNAGGVDYTTTSDIMLVDPDDGLVIPDYTNIAVKLYEADGITEIASDYDKLKEIFCSNDTTWLLTQNGKAYGCGNNVYGQQGGGSSYITAFTDRTPANETVVSICCSDQTTWLLTDSGKAYGCGVNDRGQQGSGDTTNVTAFTDRTPANETVVSISCTRYTTWLLTESGKAYGCGLNLQGQQGSGDTTDVTAFTDRTPANETVVSIFSSVQTTWLLTDSGKAYGCGNNAGGQQGSGDTTDVTAFTDRTPANETVVSICCSNDTTWLLTESGKAYGCGKNDTNQQGNGNTTNVTAFTDRTPANETVVSICCSYRTSWLLTDSGKIYGCGFNSDGQQGSGNTNNVTAFTDRTPANETVVSICCSGTTTWLLADSGKIYGCGDGNYGQQGSGNSGSSADVKAFTDRTPANETVVSICCSDQTTWLLADSGKIYGCGRGNSGQQGSGDAQNNVLSLTERDIGLPATPTIITYTDTDLTIKDIVIESQPTIYLISTIAALDTAGLIYVESTETLAEYYADPANVLSFSAAANSYYVGKGAEILNSYDSSAELQTNEGTATKLSNIYTYSEAFPVTASGVTSYTMLIDDSYTGTYTEREGAIDNDLWVILATLTVTLTIVGVVIGAVRMIGGRE